MGLTKWPYLDAVMGIAGYGVVALLAFYGVACFCLWAFERWQAHKLEKDDQLYRLKRRLRFYYVSKDCKGLNPPSAALHKAAEAYGIQNSQGLYVEDIIMKIVDKELKQ